MPGTVALTFAVAWAVLASTPAVSAQGNLAEQVAARADPQTAWMFADLGVLLADGEPWLYSSGRSDTLLRGATSLRLASGVCRLAAALRSELTPAVDAAEDSEGLEARERDVIWRVAGPALASTRFARHARLEELGREVLAVPVEDGVLAALVQAEIGAAGGDDAFAQPVRARADALRDRLAMLVAETFDATPVVVDASILMPSEAADDAGTEERGPTWITREAGVVASDNGPAVFAVGTGGPGRNRSMQLQVATMRGRVGLARALQVCSQSLVRDLLNQHPDLLEGEEAQTIEFLESVGRQTADVCLVASRHVGSWSDPGDGSLFILVSIDLPEFLSAYRPAVAQAYGAARGAGTAHATDAALEEAIAAQLAALEALDAEELEVALGMG